MQVSISFKPVEVSSVPLWQFKPASNPRWQAMTWSQERGNTSGAPDIIPLDVGGGRRVQLTREWQQFIRILNPNMTAAKVAALLGDAVAFTNKTGFGDIPMQNWITMQDLTANALPELDKVRTCSYACHTGRVEGSELVLSVLNGNELPPDISTVNPIVTPYLFFYASIVYVNSNGVEVSRQPFVQSAPAWGHDRNVTVMPLVSNYQIRIPLDWVTPVHEYSLPYFP